MTALIRDNYFTFFLILSIKKYKQQTMQHNIIHNNYLESFLILSASTKSLAPHNILFNLRKMRISNTTGSNMPFVLSVRMCLAIDHNLSTSAHDPKLKLQLMHADV